jgi:hypothetical protein
MHSEGRRSARSVRALVRMRTCVRVHARARVRVYACACRWVCMSVRMERDGTRRATPCALPKRAQVCVCVCARARAILCVPRACAHTDSPASLGDTSCPFSVRCPPDGRKRAQQVRVGVRA